jgi:hypothetical protein
MTGKRERRLSGRGRGERERKGDSIQEENSSA